MRDVRERPELLLESVQRVRIPSGQRLESDDGVSFPIVRAIHDAEPAGADAAFDGKTFRPLEFLGSALERTQRL
jgi:hypothetical protein